YTSRSRSISNSNSNGADPIGTRGPAADNPCLKNSQADSQSPSQGIELFGWEAWTRTRIARSRVWSPTDWTTSQQGKEQKGTAARSRGSGQPRFAFSNLIGNHKSVNRAARFPRVRCS